MRNDITARMHDSVTPHPRIIGSSANNAGGTKSFNLLLLGEREIMLSSNSYGSANIAVDNFILLEVTTPGSIVLWGSGTADAPPDSGSILVGGQPVPFTSNASGGTDRFTPVNLASLLPQNQNLVFKASALDCGGVGSTTDVYLLFR
jgi:hypothetical protein